nr:uncharacterized protein CI109_002760 [Kwoniella shandongensis]KAA5529002.1 hypothetical protein CI109_002760 [Kwoniella shandongensis]
MSLMPNSIIWDGESYQLPPEMITSWDLPLDYTKRSYADDTYKEDIPTASQTSLGGKVQEELEGILERMGSRDGDEDEDREAGPATPLKQTSQDAPKSIMRTPLMNHSTTFTFKQTVLSPTPKHHQTSPKTTVCFGSFTMSDSDDDTHDNDNDSTKGRKLFATVHHEIETDQLPEVDITLSGSSLRKAISAAIAELALPERPHSPPHATLSDPSIDKESSPAAVYPGPGEEARSPPVSSCESALPKAVPSSIYSEEEVHQAQGRIETPLGQECTTTPVRNAAAKMQVIGLLNPAFSPFDSDPHHPSTVTQQLITSTVMSKSFSPIPHPGQPSSTDTVNSSSQAHEPCPLRSDGDHQPGLSRQRSASPFPESQVVAKSEEDSTHVSSEMTVLEEEGKDDEDSAFVTSAGIEETPCNRKDDHINRSDYPLNDDNMAAHDSDVRSPPEPRLLTPTADVDQHDDRSAVDLRQSAPDGDPATPAMSKRTPPPGIAGLTPTSLSPTFQPKGLRVPPSFSLASAKCRSLSDIHMASQSSARKVKKTSSRKLKGAMSMSPITYHIWSTNAEQSAAANPKTTQTIPETDLAGGADENGHTLAAELDVSLNSHDLGDNTSCDLVEDGVDQEGITKDDKTDIMRFLEKENQEPDRTRTVSSSPEPEPKHRRRFWKKQEETLQPRNQTRSKTIAASRSRTSLASSSSQVVSGERSRSSRGKRKLEVVIDRQELQAPQSRLLSKRQKRQENRALQRFWQSDWEAFTPTPRRAKTIAIQALRGSSYPIETADDELSASCMEDETAYAAVDKPEAVPELKACTPKTRKGQALHDRFYAAEEDTVILQTWNRRYPLTRAVLEECSQAGVDAGFPSRSHGALKYSKTGKQEYNRRRGEAALPRIALFAIAKDKLQGVTDTAGRR